MTHFKPRAAAVRSLAAVLLLIGLRPALAGEGVKTAVVALGLWSDPVFASEASGAAKVVAARFGHGAPVIVLSNSAHGLAAGPPGMARALEAARRGLDPDRDVLFLVLTSHGSRDGIVEKGDGRMGLLSPDALGEILAKSPVRLKAVVVSACFAGIYTALANADTLIITAADSTHPSFGCVPEARWTYFGDAFFNQALRHTASIPQAFADARRIVAAREGQQGFDPSNPQIAGGEHVIAALEGAQPGH